MNDVFCPNCQAVSVNAQDKQSLLPEGSFFYCVKCKISFSADDAQSVESGKETDHWTWFFEDNTEIISEGAYEEGWA